MKGNPMLRVDPKKIEEVTEEVVVALTDELGDIKLSHCSTQACIGKESCAACTRLSDPYNTGIVLCADKAFTERLTEHMMGEEVSCEEDIEDYFTEFFNVLCGRFFREIHRLTKVAAIFQVPEFVGYEEGQEYLGDGVKHTICFITEQNERVCVMLDKAEAEKVV